MLNDPRPGTGQAPPRLRCHRCRGSGRCPCETCRGTGEIFHKIDAMGRPTMTRCTSCYGTRGRRCTNCGGEGTIDPQHMPLKPPMRQY